MDKMDKELINNTIDKTVLRGVFSADDIERWQEMDKTTKDKPQLWLSILISMGASVDMQPTDVDKIMRSVLSGDVLDNDSIENLQNDSRIMLISPSNLIDISMRAEKAFRNNDPEKAESLWLTSLEEGLNSRMSIAEPYRMFGNVASSAFANGNLVLGEVALGMALELNPNYSFGQKLKDRLENGEFTHMALSKIDHRRFDDEILSEKDLETKSNKQLFEELKNQGIELDEASFVKLAGTIKDSIETLIKQIVANVVDKTKIKEDYLHFACQVLWSRLVTRPLMEDIIDIHYDLEETSMDSVRYYELIAKLAWVFQESDKMVFDSLSKYPFEMSGVRYDLHYMLATEVLLGTPSANNILLIAEAGLETGYFPDMMVHDIVRRIESGKKWQHQLEKLVDRYPEYSQVMVMGVIRGLLEVGEHSKVIGVGRQLAWDRVLSGDIEPDVPAIYSIADYIYEAYECLGDKKALRKFDKEQVIVERIVSQKQKSEQVDFDKKSKRMFSKILQDEGKYKELFEYFDFIKSLGLDFATKDMTNDSLTTVPPFSSVKIGRNDPCPCGSGKKYKKCHLVR